jgi:N-methylhydantoinase B/oxoprolinase/acetone carboxylase alpha subunit
LSVQIHCFPSNNNGSAGKGRYRAGRGVNLAQWSFLGLKIKNIHVFFSFPKKFLLRIFLVIGVKPGKSSGMGEKIKRLKSESGKAKKSKNSSIY